MRSSVLIYEMHKAHYTANLKGSMLKWWGHLGEVQHWNKQWHKSQIGCSLVKMYIGGKAMKFATDSGLNWQHFLDHRHSSGDLLPHTLPPSLTWVCLTRWKGCGDGRKLLLVGIHIQSGTGKKLGLLRSISLWSPQDFQGFTDAE